MKRGPNNPNKRPIIAKISYTLGAFGNDFFYFALSTLLITFITTQLFDTGDSAKDAMYVLVTTNVIMILRIAELFIDPFIGNMIDRTRTRWGHFRPWIVIGGVICSVLLMILFTNLGGLSNTNPLLFIVLFAVMYLIMDIFYSSKDIGFWSMLPALTMNNKERENMATVARVGSSLGNAGVNFVAMPIVLAFSAEQSANGDLSGWAMFGFVVCAVSVITSILVGVFTREKEDDLRENKEDTKGIGAVLKMLVKNDQLMWIAIPYVCYCVGTMVLTQLQLLYFQFIVGDAMVYSTLQLANMAVGLIAVLTFPFITRRFKRKNLFFMGIIMMLAGILVYVIADKNIVLAIIGAELFYFPQQIMFLVVLMIITDCIEYGQWKLGHRDESLALAVRPLVDKFGSAVATGVTGLCAVLTGINATATAETITFDGMITFKIIMFAVPAILLIISLLIFLKKCTLSEKRHAEIVEELKKNWKN